MMKIVLITIIFTLNSCKDSSDLFRKSTASKSMHFPDYAKILSQRLLSEECYGEQFGAGVACLRLDAGKAALHFNAPVVSIYADTPELRKIRGSMQGRGAIAIRFDSSFLPAIKQEILDELSKYNRENPIDIFMIIQGAPEEDVNKGCQIIAHDWAFFGVGIDKKNYGLPAVDSRRNIDFAVFDGSRSVVKPGASSLYIGNKAQSFEVNYHNELWSPDNRRIACPKRVNTSFWSLVMDHDKSAITLHWLIEKGTMNKFIDIFWEDEEDEHPRVLTVKEWLVEAIKLIPGSDVLPSLFSLIPEKNIDN